MPLFDGTGPKEDGPRTGRGRGPCGIGIRNFMRTKSGVAGLVSLSIPVIAAVVNDACKSDSVTRRLYRVLKKQIISNVRRETCNQCIGSLHQGRGKK